MYTDPSEMQTRLDFELPGKIDPDEQKRGEAVLGRNSYALLASKAYRFGNVRGVVMQTLVDAFLQYLSAADGTNASLRCKLLLWAIESHLFMHAEDLAALLYATDGLAERWEATGAGEDELILDRYLSFGDSALGCGANPVSVLQHASRSYATMMRALWLPSKGEWRKMHPEVPVEQWQRLRQTADHCRSLARGILGGLQSDVSREWYEMYLRYKHGAPLVALDLLNTTVTFFHPDALSEEDAEAVRAEVDKLRTEMHIILPQAPRTGQGRKAAEGRVLWRFDCTADIAQKALRFDRAMAKLEVLVSASVTVRAGSHGCRSFAIIKEGRVGS